MRGRELGITFAWRSMRSMRAEQLTAIDALAELGVDHILTHGGPANMPIEDNYEHLRALIAHAGDRL
ncbi:MAG: copper homeostasis protein CutC [Collinsella sp.]